MKRQHHTAHPSFPQHGRTLENLDSAAMSVWVAMVSAYVVGSLDFAVLVSRARGIDIRSVGSGNPGASNVLRALGKGPAVMVFVGDAFKGVIGAAMGWIAAAGGDPAVVPMAFAAGLAAVFGHAYPVFHRFRGGRGVATGAGVLLFTIPWAALVLAIVWFLVARISKIAAVASLTVVVASVPLAYVAGVRGWAFFWLGGMLALIVVRHVPNIRRMLGGSEQKVPT